MLTKLRFIRLYIPTPRQAGFTLLELLIVLAILALLAGLVGPKLLDQLSSARSGTAAIQIKNVEAALDLFRLDVGRYPSNGEGLKALIEKPADATRWRGPYLKSSEGLLDPWGIAYRYSVEATGGGFAIVSYGADKAEGGEGENKDIRN
ncbi:MAG: general secretion pathway protein G [Alphaproteobacteria bacterium]|jgi:general secretion pathway protein G